MFSTVLLACDERDNIRPLRESLPSCDDWILVDSGSRDGTAEEAERAGYRVFSNPFSGFGTQRNWALEHGAPRHGWVLFLDADERGTPAFEKAVRASIAEAAQETAGFYLCGRTLLNGRWLKRSDSFPKWQFRLARVGRARFVDHGHGQKEGAVDGSLAYIREPYDHLAFQKGWDHWFAKHNRYSAQEAAQRAVARADWRGCFSAHGSRRNAALKTTVGKLRVWPLLRFLHSYFVKAGFVEGIEGLHYCAAMMSYEWMIQVKLRAIELEKKMAASRGRAA